MECYDDRCIPADTRNKWKEKELDGSSMRYRDIDENTRYWIETRTETKDGLTMIAVNTSEGLNKIDPWRKRMKEVSDIMSTNKWTNNI